MKDKPNTIPAGTQVLGRVLNANGEPIDGKGPITGAQRIPLYRPVSTTADDVRTSPVQMFETGIKVIDLLAPIPRGGIASMVSGIGQGKMVVTEEMMHTIIGQIVFSRELAKQNVWPAIDRLFSSSRLLENGAIDAEHVQIARQVKQILQRYGELRDVAESKELAQEDQEVVKRAQKIHLFFTQPFFVAEAYTDVLGEYVPVEETVRSFKDLLEGRYDDVPVEAFRFVGAIEQALARGKTFENPSEEGHW